MPVIQYHHQPNFSTTWTPSTSDIKGYNKFQSIMKLNQRIQLIAKFAFLGFFSCGLCFLSSKKRKELALIKKGVAVHYVLSPDVPAIEGTLAKVRRQALENLNDITIPADKKAYRCVVLKHLDKNLFGVRLVPEKDPSAVPLLFNQQLIYAHKKDLIDRLLLPKQLKLRHLSYYLDRTYLAINNFHRIRAKMKKFNHTKPFSSASLMWLIRCICKKYPRSETLFFKGKTIAPGFKGDKLYLHDLTHLKSIRGEPAIFKTQSLITGHQKIFKMVRSHREASHEVELLAKLHAKFEKRTGQSRMPGLQKSFHGTCFYNRSIGILQTAYMKDLKDLIVLDSFNISFKIYILHGLLQGFNYCVKEGLIHQDIKPENILVNKKFELFLSDFGGSQLCGEIQAKKKYDLKWTPRFILLDDLRRKINLRDELQTKKHNLNDFENFCKKVDIFSLAITMIEVLYTGSDEFMEYDRIERPSGAIDEYPKAGSLKLDLLRRAGIPERLCLLLKRMMDPNYRKRPNMEFVMKEYDKVLKDIYGRNLF